MSALGVRYLRAALTGLLWCGAVGLLIQNLLLIHQNRTLRAAAQSPEVRAGARIEPLNAMSASGTQTTVELPSTESERLLVITFSTSCPYCRDNMPGYRRLAEALRAVGSWRVVWVSQNLEKATRQFSQEQHLPLADVFWDTSHRTYSQLGLDTVPNALAIDYLGFVRRVWRGKLGPQNWRDIADYTGVPYQAVFDSSASAAGHTD